MRLGLEDGVGLGSEAVVRCLLSLEQKILTLTFLPPLSQILSRLTQLIQPLIPINHAPLPSPLLLHPHHRLSQTFFLFLLVHNLLLVFCVPCFFHILQVSLYIRSLINRFFGWLFAVWRGGPLPTGEYGDGSEFSFGAGGLVHGGGLS